MIKNFISDDSTVIYKWSVLNDTSTNSLQNPKPQPEDELLYDILDLTNNISL